MILNNALFFLVSCDRKRSSGCLGSHFPFLGTYELLCDRVGGEKIGGPDALV